VVDPYRNPFAAPSGYAYGLVEADRDVELDEVEVVQAPLASLVVEANTDHPPSGLSPSDLPRKVAVAGLGLALLGGVVAWARTSHF